jgi:hypothetical protein
MKTQTSKMQTNGVLLLLMTWVVLGSGAATAQVPVDENGAPVAAMADDNYSQAEAMAAAAPLTTAELEELVGPVALYPDDLLAIVLPASTYPLEIVQAARFLQLFESDSSLKPDESWDESVTALINYPEVIQMMDDDIDWTWRLGEAVVSQQAAVIAAVEMFRDRAYAAGNLKSDEYQTVSLEEGAIEIEPADEEIIYVPYYEPAEVVVYQPQPVYRYYPRSYPVYYYPYPVGHNFSSGYFWGVTTAFTIGWSNHNLHVYHPSYFGHPYYGHNYYGHYYRRPSVNVYNSWYVNNSYRTSQYNHRDGDYWRPRQRSGSRPYTNRVRNRHYPPGSVAQTRNHTNTSSRNTGRMELGLRERDRSTSNSNRQARVTTTASNRRDPGSSGATGQRGDRNVRDTTERGNSSNRRTTSGQTEIRFRERNDATRRASTPARSAANNSNRRQQAPASARRVISAANTRQVTAAAASSTGSNQRVRPTTSSRQTSRVAPAARQQSPQIVAQRPPARPVVQRSAAQPQRVAAAPQRRVPAQRSARQTSSRGDVGSRPDRKESSPRERTRERK